MWAGLSDSLQSIPKKKKKHPGTFYKIPNHHTLQKCQGPERQGKIIELLEIGGDQGDVTTKCNVGSWILVQKKVINGKIENICSSVNSTVVTLIS